jgi:hypothetical protein
MVRPERFELPTYGFVDHRSIQLSYGRTVLETAQTEAKKVYHTILQSRTNPNARQTAPTHRNLPSVT